MTVSEPFKAFAAGLASRRVHVSGGPSANQTELTDKGAAHRDQVRLAALEYLLQESGRPQTAHHDDRHLDRFLDLSGPGAEVNLFLDPADWPKVHVSYS